MPAPSLVLFDVVETLVSLEPVRDALPAAGLPPEALDLVFTRVLRDAFALAAAGTPRSFPDVARSVLGVLAPDAGEDGAAQVMAAFGRLPAHPDAAPALALLRDAGVRVAAVSNGSLASTRRVLEANGLAAQLEDVLSVDDAGTWKPRAEVYRYAVDRFGVAPEQAALVAVHAWDCHGASRAGLRSGWCSRLEGTWSSAFDRADVEGADLVEVARGLLEPPARP